MFHSPYFWIAILIVWLPVVGSPSVSIPPTIDMDQTERPNEGIAPPPFGRVQFNLDLSPESRIVGLDITIGGIRVIVDPDIYSDLDNPSDVELVYANPSMTATGTVEYIALIFEFGSEYSIELGDVPGCKSPCRDIIRDIVETRVNADMNVQKIIVSLREIFGKET